ncbi:MAG: peptide chain release factor N(5)-glutamine methyltransferase [Candidatus Bipolaricaulota bacterium]|nr:peptide chain release factor N(5)-glutamine methyltransferase [Candidatus Bipolaricaulota bacterium]MDW8031423.1 peptide chain release factor N(5)-glutamine methyltransferase [Candidatus Bipolaricaulota bacterium]
MMKPTKTVGEELRWATEQLRPRCGESARLEAEFLLTHVLQQTRLELYLRAQESVTPKQHAQLCKLVERRRRGEPLQYLLGHAEFFGCSLRLTPGVFIPRPETEELVALIVARSSTPPAHVLDLGTGSGAISIALARAWPESSFVAVDISPKALALARENARRNGVAERIRFVRSDWFSHISERFDLIVSNPPYVRRGYLERAPRELRYEPQGALDGGPEGLDALTEIIRESPAHLRPGGVLYLEIGSDQGSCVRRLLQETNAFGEIETLKDLTGQDRFARAVRSDYVAPGASL